MKYIAILIVPIICLVCITSANADLTVKQYEEAINSKDETRVSLLEVYILGVGHGLYHNNVVLNQRGNKPLYCEVKKLGLNADNYIQILNSTIAESRKRGLKKVDDASIALVLYLGLMAAFPCPE